MYKRQVYKVTDPSKKTVAAVKGNDVSAITIAKSVKIKGITCTVTKIADKAFMNAKKQMCIRDRCTPQWRS